MYIFADRKIMPIMRRRWLAIGGACCFATVSGATGGRSGQSTPLYARGAVVSAASSLSVHYTAHHPPAIRR
jgi:hypothetical protein